mgnify:CR=1 FL=1
MVHWWNMYKLVRSRGLVSCACPFELLHVTEGGLLWLLVHRSCLFMAWYSLLYSMICWDCGCRSLLCGMEEFATEAVWWSIAMSAVGWSNSRMASWRPHFLVSMHLIWHLILVRVTIWFEYCPRYVVGAVYPCCTLTSLPVEVSLSLVFGVGLCILWFE